MRVSYTLFLSNIGECFINFFLMECIKCQWFGLRSFISNKNASMIVFFLILQSIFFLFIRVVSLNENTTTLQLEIVECMYAQDLMNNTNCSITCLVEYIHVTYMCK